LKIKGKPVSGMIHASWYRREQTRGSVFQVEPVVVPLPAAVWLFGAGLGLLSVFARKKK
jgi:hypothetical protein